MMKAGGQARRDELIQQFGELSVSKANVRDYTAHEKKIISGGDTGQGERLNQRKQY